MKKQWQILFIMTAMVGLGMARPAAAQIQFGVTAGLNFDRLSDVAWNDVDANFENKTGWHAGVWVDFSMGPLALRPGVRYMQAGQLFTGLSDVSSNIRSDFDINLVEVPILLRYGFGAPVVRPYIFAGPVLRFPSGNDEVINSDLKSVSYAGELGLGLELSLGGIHLYPEIAYTFGVSQFIKDDIIIGHVPLSADESQKLNTAMVRLGVGL